MPSEGSTIDAQDVRGLKYLRRLLPLFERLREVGCGRDVAGNRQLHFDQYCTLVMLYLFNPLIDSLRCLQHASGLPNVQKLGVGRFAPGSFSWPDKGSQIFIGRPDKGSQIFIVAR